MQSGIQILVHGLNVFPKDNSVVEGHCHICGGPLEDYSHSVRKSISSSWTDTAICSDKTSQYICESCNWLCGNNFKKIWGDTPEEKFHVLVCSENHAWHLHYEELLTFLDNLDEKEFPIIILVRGKDKSTKMKHLEWKVMNNISVSKRNIIVPVSKMSVFKFNNYGFIAEFDLKDMEKYVDEFTDIINDEIVPVFPKKMNKVWTQRNYCISRLLDVCSNKGVLNPNFALAAFLAAYQLFPDEKKEA